MYLKKGSNQPDYGQNKVVYVYAYFCMVSVVIRKHIHQQAIDGNSFLFYNIQNGSIHARYDKSRNSKEKSICETL